MKKFCAATEATGSTCLPDAVSLNRRPLENALVDLDQAVAASDDLGYEKAFQAILGMISPPLIEVADAFEDYFGPADVSPEALAIRRLSDRDAKYRGRL